MGMAVKRELLSVTDYLAGEEFAPRKREYRAGEVYPMPDSSARHNRITLNLYAAIDAATRGTTFELFVLDVKLLLSAHQAIYYPDVMLVGPGDDNHPLYRTSPCLIVEVLSPSTAGIDEREKWRHYRGIPSLRYYLLIDSEKRHARIRSREGDKDSEGWLEQTLDEDDIVTLTCGPVSASLCLDDIYERSGL
ncbi:MAG: Uma2 family endonuclease [Gammaproteobacteria bacterium]|nr:Uma2 family endonuclease [Gammaproteobacteria bacterium]